METFKGNILKNKKIILIVILSIFLALSITIFFYNSTYKSETLENSTTDKNNMFLKISNEINTINNTLEDCPVEFALNNDSIIDILNSNITDLEKTKNELRAMIILDDYTREICSKILSSIDSTQNLYNYCIASLDFNNSYSLLDYITKINEEEYDLLISYQELNSLGIELEFTDGSLSFFDKLINYLSSVDNIAKKNSINQSQANDFLKEFKTAVADLSALAQDLRPAIEKAREDNRSFDSILDDISNKEASYISIKSRIKSISVPEGYVSYYNSLMDAFNLYSNYLKTLKVAIIYENSSTNYNDNKDLIDKNYDNAFSKLQDVKESINTLNKSLENS